MHAIVAAFLVFAGCCSNVVCLELLITWVVIANHYCYQILSFWGKSLHFFGFPFFFWMTIEAEAGRSSQSSQRWGRLLRRGPMRSHVCAKCLYRWCAATVLEVSGQCVWCILRVLCCMSRLGCFVSLDVSPSARH